MSAQDNSVVAQKHYDLFNKRRLDQALATIVAEDVEWTSVPFDTSFHGLEGYRQFLESWINAMPDSQVEITSLVADADMVATEFTGRGTHTGDFNVPAGPIPATGRRVELPFCEMMYIHRGKIVGIHTYFDAATIMRQLGVSEERL